jgi:hypothetical protein
MTTTAAKTKKRKRGWHIDKHEVVRTKGEVPGESAAILTDLEGFRKVLANTLTFYGFVHDFERLSKEKRTDIGLINDSLRRFVKQYSLCIYRGDDSSDCNTGKVHAHLHLGKDILSFGHPMNWDAGKGERGLKVWAKQVGRRAQKQSIKIFTAQTASRITELALFRVAVSQGLLKKDIEEQEACTTSVFPQAPHARRLPHYLLDLDRLVIKKRSHGPSRSEPPTISSTGLVIKIVSIEGKETISMSNPFNAFVIQSLSIEEKAATPSTRMIIKVWKDAFVYVEGKARKIRASAKYDTHGSFFDWVEVKYFDGRLFPAKLLLIYMDNMEEMSAIVHGCEWRDDSDKQKDTPLTNRWSLECDEKRTGVPILQKIKLASITNVVYAFENIVDQTGALGLNMPLTMKNATRGDYWVDVVKPRYMWASEFLVDDYY